MNKTFRLGTIALRAVAVLDALVPRAVGASALFDALAGHPSATAVAPALAATSRALYRVATGLDDAAQWFDAQRWLLGVEERDRTKNYVVHNVFARRSYGEEYTSATIEVAWQLQGRWGFGVSADFEARPTRYDRRSLGLYLGPLAVYVPIALPPELLQSFYSAMEARFSPDLPSSLRSYDDRVIEFRVYRYLETRIPETVVTWNFWNCSSASSSKPLPLWQHCYTTVERQLFGEMKVSREVVDTIEFNVAMPERVYRWRAREERVTVSFERLRPSIVSFEVDAEALPGEEIPFPGKGENDWDIGMDATSAIGIAGDTPREKYGESIVARMQSTRKRYGWSDELAIAWEQQRAAKHSNPASVEATRFDEN